MSGRRAAAADLPGAECARVDMDEVRFRVVTDAAALQLQGRGTELGGFRSRRADVDRPPREVQALLRDARGDLAQRFVGLRRAVAGNDLETSAPAELIVEQAQRIQQLDVDRVDLVGAEVAKQVIDRLERARNDIAVLAVGDLERFGCAPTLTLSG